MFNRKNGTAKKPPDYSVVYRSPRGDGWATPATEVQAFAAFNDCVRLGHITPDNGRRLTVLGPDHDTIDDLHDPLPPLSMRLAALGEPAFPQLVQPRPVEDPALWTSPGYLPMDGDHR